MITTWFWAVSFHKMYFPFYFNGTAQRNANQVTRWYRIQTGFFVVFLAVTLLRMFSDPVIILKNAVPAAYRAWTIYVMRNFLKKLREEGLHEVVAPSTFHPMGQQGQGLD